MPQEFQKVLEPEYQELEVIGPWGGGANRAHGDKKVAESGISGWQTRFFWGEG